MNQATNSRPCGMAPMALGTILGCIVTMASLVPARATAHDPPNPYFIAGEGHVSMFADIANRSMLSSTFGYGMRGGYRHKRVGFFVSIEHNMWVTTEYELRRTNGALNIGPGVEYFFAGRRIRSSVAMGPSILLEDTILDEAGSVGIFVDLRPLGLRWDFNPRWIIGFDPLSVAYVMPAMGGIPIVQLEFRTQFYIEVHF